MKIRIRLAGFLAQSGLPSGYKGGELEVVDGTTLGQLLEQIQALDRSPWLIVVNGKSASADRVLEDGDVVQLVPRIGGGCS